MGGLDQNDSSQKVSLNETNWPQKLFFLCLKNGTVPVFRWGPPAPGCRVTRSNPRAMESNPGAKESNPGQNLSGQ